MKTSETISKLTTAMLAAQADITHPKMNAVNPHFNKPFADLLATIDATRPVLASHGLFVMQSAGGRVGEAGEQFASVTTRLVHGESGEWHEDAIEMKLDSPRGRNMQQELGVTYTYLRRYAWLAICGVFGDPDTDGHTADKDADAEQDRKPTNARTTSKPAAAKPPAKPQPASKSQLDEIKALIRATGADVDKFCEVYEVTGIGALSFDKAVKAIAKLKVKQSKMQDAAA